MKKSNKAFFKEFSLFLCFISIPIGITIAAPVVESVAISGDKLIVTGHKFLDIDGLILSDPKTGFKKPFKVESATESEIVGTAVDDQKITVASLMNLIIDTAKGETIYPVSFSLQKDAVTNPTIKNGAITPDKFLGVTTSNPPDQTVLTWSQATQGFIFTKASAGAGSSGVSEIVLGPGIIGAPNTASGSVPVSVDIGQTGDALKTKIPYFNSSNKIILDSTNSPTGALSGLSLKDGTKNFDIFNDNALRIDSEAAADLLVLDSDGSLSLKGPVTVGGFDVCLSNGNCIPSSGLTLVTATAPLVAAKVATGTTNISAGAVNTANNLVQLESTGKFPANIPGVVRGPGSAARSATQGNLAIFSDTTGEKLGDGGIGLQNIVSMSATPTSANKVVISTGTNKVLGTTSYTIPNTSGVTGQVLGITATNTASWVDASGVDSFNGRTGAVTSLDGDYSAAQVTNLPFGIITALTVQQAIDQLADLDSQKLPISGGTMTGTIKTTTQKAIFVGAYGSDTGEIRFFEIEPVAPSWVGFKAPANIATSTVWTLPAADGTSGQVLSTNGSKVLGWASAGSAGIGDVVGPASSISTNLATFNGATGKLIADSGISSSDLVTMSGTGSVTTGNVIITGGGKLAQDSNVPLSNLPIMENPAIASNTIILSAGNSKNLISTPYTIPPNIGSATYVLKSDGTNVQWAADASGSGDVVGPATSASNTLAQFSDSTGKIIKGTAWTVPNSIGLPGQFLTVSGATDLNWTSLPTSLVQVGGAPVVADNLSKFGGTDGTQIIDSGIATVNVATMAVAAASSNTVILSGGADKTLTSTAYTIPSSIGSANFVLKSDGTNATWQADVAGTGDVVGPATAILNSIARYASGKVIKESGIIIDDANNISGVNQLNGKVANNLVTGSGLIGNLPIFGLLPNEIEDSQIPLANIPTMASDATAEFQPILSGGINKSQIAAPYTLPNSSCLSGQVLKWNATGFTCQSDLSGSGDVVGPAFSTVDNLASFSSGNGKVIKDSGINSANIPTMATAPLANQIIISSGTGKQLTATLYPIPAAIGASGTVLKSDGTNATWQSDNAGTGVAGPNPSTINAIAKYGDTTGNTILNSGVLIDNLNNVSGVKNFTSFGALNNEGSMANKGSFTNYGSLSNNGDFINYDGTFTNNGPFTNSGNMTIDTNTLHVDSTGNRVGIGTTTPDGSAILDLTSTSKGLLLSRMTSDQRDAIISPADGLMIYNSTTNSFDGRAGGAWKPVGAVPSVNDQTGTSYTITSSDCGSNVSLNNASAISVFVPVLAPGCEIDLVQTGAGQVTVSGSGITVGNSFGLFKTRAQYSVVTVKMMSASLAVLIGDLN